MVPFLLSILLYNVTLEDSFELYYGLYKYNSNARGQLDKLEEALRMLRQRLQAMEEQEKKSRL